MRLMKSILLVLAFAAPISAEPLPLAGHWEGAVVRLGAVQPIQVDFREQDGKLTATVDVPERGLLGEPAGDRRIPAPEPAAEVPLRRCSAPYGRRDGGDHGRHSSLGAGRARPPQAGRGARGRFPGRGSAVPERLRAPDRHPGSAPDGRPPCGGRPRPRLGRAGPLRFALSLLWRFLRPSWHRRPGLRQAAGLRERHLRRPRLRRRRGRAVPENPQGHRSRPHRARRLQPGRLARSLAASRVDGIAFLILQVAPSVSVEEQELQRVRYEMADEGFSEEDIARAAAYTKLVFDTAYRGGDWAKLAAATEKAKGEAWAEQVQLAASPEDLEGWHRQRYDPEPVLRKTTIPVLVLYGERDPMVPPAENAERMRGLLAAAGNRDVTIKVFRRANHSLEWFGELRQGTWRWPEGYWVWAKKAPGYAETVIGWLRARVGGP